jgi:hypothetical protein
MAIFTTETHNTPQIGDFELIVTYRSIFDQELIKKSN